MRLASVTVCTAHKTFHLSSSSVFEAIRVVRRQLAASAFCGSTRQQVWIVILVVPFELVGSNRRVHSLVMWIG
jgi:hypothetical protein